MIITPLGHTQFLIEIKNEKNDFVKILVDSWFSDYVLGDLMQRTVKVEIDYEKIRNLDAIYISHSHSDHFDPYILTKIFSEKDKKLPILILPFTLEYLVPLIKKYLGEIEIKILFPDKAFVLNGVNITGYIFSQSQITNEDDVMMLGVSNSKELVFAEIDTLPEEYDFEVQKKLYKIFTQKKYETSLYLSSRNELEGQIPLFDLPETKRKSFSLNYKKERKETFSNSYEKFEYEDYEDFSNIFTIPGFCRGFIGQGITYPEFLSKDLSNLSIFPLDEISNIENDLAKKFGYSFSQKALNPGRQYIIENSEIKTGRKDCPIGKLIINHEKNTDFSGERSFSNGPLLSDLSLLKDISSYKNDLENILNNRFLPYWSASSMASLRESLIKNDGKYSISFLNDEEKVEFSFEFNFKNTKFIEKNDIKNADEKYFLRDIIDFLEGRQELYSNFWHKLDQNKIYRLWTCLGANFCNHDLILEKYNFHFERAKNGENINSFVENILEKIKNN